MIQELEEDEIFNDFLNDFDGDQQITFQEFNKNAYFILLNRK